jgi:hypothetical protein
MLGTSSKLETSSGKDRATHLDEWKKARDILQFFDGKLHDLRKYGFSFVTALLTVEGILLLRSGGVTMSDSAKVAVFGVTMLLILALHLIDQNYKFYQRAANMRALVLERKLNLELSEIITDRYKAKDINKRVLLLYIVFIVGVLCLGGVALYPNLLYIAGLSAIALAAICLTILTFLLDTTFKYKYKEDWTISPLECTPTDKVTITLTNLSPNEIKLKDLKDAQKRLKAKLDLDKDFEKVKEELPDSDFEKIRVREPIVFPEGKIRWEIIPEGGGDPVGEAPKDEELHVYNSHTWIWDISNVGEGVYQLRPRGWPLPLQRRIIVSDDTGEKTEEKGEITGN